jgi:hypothetical protein
MTTYLFIFQIIISTTYAGNIGGWSNAGQFESPDACFSAALALNVAAANFKCISKVSGRIVN